MCMHTSMLFPFHECADILIQCWGPCSAYTQIQGHWMSKIFQKLVSVLLLKAVFLHTELSCCTLRSCDLNTNVNAWISQLVKCHCFMQSICYQMILRPLQLAYYEVVLNQCSFIGRSPMVINSPKDYFFRMHVCQKGVIIALLLEYGMLF